MYDLNANSFSNGRAQLNGGAVYYDLYQPLDLLANTFENNSAQYGADYASYPSKLGIISNDTSWTQSFVSGADVANAIYVGIYDQNNQLVVTDNTSTCILSSSDLVLQISGVTKVKAINGVYVFDQINLIALPNYGSELTFTSTAITVIPTNANI